METGAALRDAGIETVLSNSLEWSELAESQFDWWLQNEAPEEFTLEQFRLFWDSFLFPQPHHHNAWGGLAKRFANRIQPVGYTTSARPQAHARVTRTYRRA